MENEIKSKSIWQKPEIIDLDIDLTNYKLLNAKETTTFGPS